MDQDIQLESESLSSEFKQPLNVKDIFSYISQGQQAEQLGDGQSVLLLLGPTGCGKSTTANFFLGKNMIQKQIEQEVTLVGIESTIKQKIKVIIPEKEEEFIIGHQKESQTIILKVAEIPQYKFILCDSPGFFDSRSVEVEIANYVCLKNFIQKCKSVRPIVLINYKDLTAARGDLIKKLFNIIVNILDISQEKIFSKILFFYTHISNNETIQDIQNEHISLYQFYMKNSKQNQSQIELLQVLLKQIEQYEESLILKPLDNNSQQYLETIVKQTPFENPQKEFILSISEKANQSLCQYSLEVFNQLEQWMKDNRYKDIFELLKTFKLLRDLVQNEFLDTMYNRSLDNIKMTIEKETNDTLHNFRESAKTDRFLANSTIQKILQITQQLLVFTQYKTIFYRDFFLSQDTFLKEIKQTSLEISKSAIDHFCQNIQITKNELLKLQNMSEQIEQIQEIYDDCKKQLLELYSIKSTQTLQSIEDFFKNKNISIQKKQYITHQIDEFVAKFKAHQQIESFLFNFYQQDNYKFEFYNKIIDNFSQKNKINLQNLAQNLESIQISLQNLLFEDSSNQLQNKLVQDKLRDSSQNIQENSKENQPFNYVNKICIDFEVITLKYLGQHQQINQHMKGAIEDYKKAQVLIQEFVEFAFKNFQNCYKEKSLLKKMQYVLFFIDQIRKLDESVYAQTEEEYNRFKTFLEYKIKKKKQQAKSILSNYIEEQMQDFTFEQYKQQKTNPSPKKKLEKVSQLFEFLQKMKWTDQYFLKSICQNTIQNMTKKLNDQLQYCVNKCQYFTENNKLTELSYFLQILENLQILEKEINSYHQIKNNCFIEVQSIILKKIKQIEQQFQEMKESKKKDKLNENMWVNLNKNLILLIQIDQLKQIQEIRNQANILKQQIERFLQAYYQENYDYIKQNSQFQKLTDIIQNNKHKRWTTFINNIYFINTECPEIEECFEKSQKPQKLNDLISQIYEHLVEQYDEKKFRSGDLQQIASQYELIKQFTNEFRNIFQSLYDNFKTLSNPNELISQTFLKIQQCIRKEKYDIIIEILNKITNLQDPQYKENLKQIFQSLQSKFESTFNNLNQLIVEKKQINDEFIYCIKNSLSKLDSIFKIFSNYKRKSEKNQAQKQISQIQCLFNSLIYLQMESICNYAKQIEFKNMEKNYNLLQQLYTQIQQFQIIQIDDSFIRSLKKSVEDILNGQLQIINIKSPITLKKLFEELKYSTKIQNSIFENSYATSKQKLDSLVNQYFDERIQQIESQIHSNQTSNPKQMLQRITNYLEEFQEKGIPFDFDLYQKISSVKYSIEDQNYQMIQKFYQLIENKEGINKISEQLNEIKNKNSEFYQMIRNKIKKDFTNSINCLNEQFTKMNYQEFSKCLDRTWLFKKCFEVEFTEQFQDLINNLIQNSEEFLKQFDKMINFNLQFENEQEITQFFKHTQFLQQLNGIDEIQQNTQINKIIFRYNNTKQFIKDQLNNLRNDQQNILELQNFKDCEDIQKQCNKFDLLIKFLQQGNLEKQQICEEFIKIGQQVMTFEQLFQRVQKKFSINKNEIQNIWEKGEFYKIKEIILKINQYKILSQYFQSEIIDQNKIIKIIEKEANNMTKNATTMIQSSFEFDNNLKILINKIYQAEEILKDINGLIFNKQSQIQIINSSLNKKIDEIIQSYLQTYKENDDIEEFVNILIKMQNIANIKQFSKIVDQKIDQALQKFNKIARSQELFTLAHALQKSVHGATIVNQQPIFTTVKQSQFNNLVGRHDKDYILKNFQFSENGENEQDFTSEQIKNLDEHFKKYQLHFDKLLDDYCLKQEESWQEIINEAIKEVKTSGITLNHWDNDLKQKIPKILAHICAYWTLTNSVGQLSKLKETNSFKKPNHSQILSIFILLGFEQMDKFVKNVAVQTVKKIGFLENHFQKILQNRLIQILTGEGKSLILGFCSILLGLLGCSVQVVCYSQYLSLRDEKDFQQLLEKFGVQNKIQYGTFEQLAENIINNKGDVRDLTKQHLHGKKIKDIKKEKDNSPKILLIDEVDIFFNLDFYGQTYNIGSQFQTPEVKVIIRKIWELRNQSSDEIYENIQSCQAYINLQQKYPKLIKYFDDQIKMLSQNVKDVEKHEQEFRYIIKKDQIGYKQLDSSYSFYTRYKYDTLFAYFHKNQQKLISDGALKKQLVFDLDCGSLSYALIPKNYCTILGVSGTLKSLNPTMKQVLKKYNFKKEIYAPSMFGQSNRDFKEVDMVMVEKDLDNQYIQIQNISEAAYKNKQSILIFFKDKIQKLCIPSNKYIQLTEDLKQEDVDEYVRKSTLSQNIALCVREYGRGTDFECLDPEVEKNGGVVVIQTFLSEDKIEEIQIMGRTARQAKKGKYYLILNQTDLQEEFDISKQQIFKWKNNQTSVSLYRNLTQIRDKKQNELYTNIEKKIEIAQNMHEKTQQYYDDLYQSNIEKIFQFTNENN